MARRISFKEFLMEIDQGDLDLHKQHRDKERELADANAAKNQFKQEMAGSSPSNGDYIQSGGATFAVVNMSMNGYHVKELGGQKTAIIPHGTKFKGAGKSEDGKPMFVIVK